MRALVGAARLLRVLVHLLHGVAMTVGLASMAG